MKQFHVERFDFTNFICVCKFDKHGKDLAARLYNSKVWQDVYNYIFHPKMMIGPDAEEEQLIILLDNRYMYEIFVHETNLFILNENCCVLPSTYVRLMPNSSNVYYRISATQHQELTRPKDPCVVDDQYNFSVCVKENIAQKVGCRPSWDIWSDQTIKHCTKIEEHR